MTDDELNRLVAEHVMGWAGRYENAGGEYWIVDGKARRLAFHPETSIADAWEVVEKLAPAEAGRFQMERRKEGWRAWFLGPYAPEIGEAIDPSAPRAICLASLRAKGIEV